jgi:LmbE family N-acetylglucosaminyl deacetylase
MASRRILILAPHPDDEVLGCGGTVCQHESTSDQVSVVFLTSGELGLKHLAREKAWKIREEEAEKAANILGLAILAFLRGPDWGVADAVESLAQELRPILERENPDRIYLPHPADDHPDHRATLAVLRRALGRFKTKPPELLAYEVWTPLPAFDQVVDITGWMPRKLTALRAHRSQLGEFDYVRAIEGLNAYRGALAAKRPYVEVFQTLELAQPS